MPTPKELGLKRGTKEYSQFMSKQNYERHKEARRAKGKEYHFRTRGRFVAEKRAALPPLLRSNGVKPRKGTINACKFCGQDFYAGPCHKDRIFCSKEHSIQWQKDHSFRFQCVICDKTVFTQPAQMTARNRKTCSKKCMGELLAKRGEENRLKNPPTEGVLRRRIRYSAKMDKWRKAVFERDNYTCQCCGARNGLGRAITLNADHIKPFAYHPELRFDLDNGRTLCVECHRKTETWGQQRKSASVPISP